MVLATDGERVDLSYSANNTVSKVVDPRGYSSSFQESTLGLNRANENGNINWLTLDAKGLLLKYAVGVDKKKQILYTHDDLGRPTGITFGENVINFGYDTPLGADLTNTKGRLAWSKYNDIIESQYAYDVMGNVAEERLQSGNNTLSLYYQHDVLGQVTTETLSDETELRYGYNPLSQLSSVTYVSPSGVGNVLKTYTYNQWGRAESIAYGNGQTYHLGYDSAGRLASKMIKENDTVVETTLYRYNAHNQIADQQTTGLLGTSHFTYEYDAEDQLIQAVLTEDGQSRTYMYRYDANGNRTSTNGDEGDQRYICYPGSNRIKTITDSKGKTLQDFSWDENGNCVEKNDYVARKKYSYVYNDLAQMEQVDITDSRSQVQVTTTVRYTYNTKGMLLTESRNGSTLTYLYDKKDRLVQLTDEQGGVIKTFLYSGTMPFAEADSAGHITYYKLDLIGSKQGECAFSPFGIPSDDEEEPIYSGKRFFKDTGLYYFHARWYDPALGRFLTRDPANPNLEDHLTLNPYTYCRNNPVMNVDPDGEFFEFLNFLIPGLGALFDAAFWAGMGKAGGNALYQGIKKGFNNINWQEVGNNFGQGAAMSMIGVGLDGLMGSSRFGGDILGNTVHAGFKQGMGNLAYGALMGQDIGRNGWNMFMGGFQTGVLSHGAKEIYFHYANNFHSLDARPGKGIDAGKYSGMSPPASPGIKNVGFPIGQRDLVSDILGHEGEAGFKGIENGMLYLGFNVMEAIDLFPGGNAIGGMHDWMSVYKVFQGGGTVFSAGIATLSTYSSFESPF